MKCSQISPACGRLSITVVVLMLICASTTICAGEFSSANLEMGTNDDDSYVAHDPIDIDGNSEFTERRGVVSGDGTASNPFVIEGWDIDAWDEDGMVIRNTDAHLVIRNCYVHDGFYYKNYGIKLTNCSNVILDGNLCPNNQYGIYLTSCDGSRVVNNDCNGNDRANIVIMRTNYSIVSNNICDISFYDDGLVLYSSNNNTITNNSCSINNFYGISLEGTSSYNSISGNQIERNYEHGVMVSSSCSNNTIWNNTFVDNNDAESSYDIGYAQAFDDGNDNRWNTSGTPHGYGNCWSDWLSPDSDLDGIVDAPYEINLDTDVKDSYPLTEPPTIPETGEPIESPSTLAMTMIALVAVTVVVVVVVLVIVVGKGSGTASQSQARVPPQHPGDYGISMGVERFCSRCGNQIAPGAVWCPKCGIRFDSKKKT